MTVRVHTPEDGWGRVLHLTRNLIHSLYPDCGEPEVLAFVRWDAGGGRYIDLARPDVVIEGAAELVAMEIELPALPPYLPVPWLRTCSCGRSYSWEAWEKLPLVGRGDGSEYRNCFCRSTISVPTQEGR